MTINEMVKQAHANAIAKGWHDEQRTFGELIALCHSELSEALEVYRDGGRVNMTHYNEGSAKPEGIPSELADVLIRIADMCGLYDIDLEAIVIEKMAYNSTRQHRHGGKVI